VPTENVRSGGKSALEDLVLEDFYCSIIIKKIPEYHPPNVYGSVEIQMFIMSNNRTIPYCSKFGCHNDDRYIDFFFASHLQPSLHSSVGKATDFLSRGQGIVSSRARIFFFFFAFFFPFLYIQMFFYTIMKLFITLLENVNKSRTGAGRLSLKCILFKGTWSVVVRRATSCVSYHLNIHHQARVKLLTNDSSLNTCN
jgi:hypothetical protein